MQRLFITQRDISTYFIKSALGTDHLPRSIGHNYCAVQRAKSGMVRFDTRVTHVWDRIRALVHNAAC